MNKKTLQLKEKADEAKYLYMIGELPYEEAKTACKAYIDHANVIAGKIAKEYDMKPQLMSVKSYMR